jgi:hypothetical protein
MRLPSLDKGHWLKTRVEATTEDTGGGNEMSPSGTASTPRLVIYIPTYENFEGALHQVASLAEQASHCPGAPWTSVAIVVSINGGAYDCESLEGLGARVIERPCNLGGDANIALGFLEARAEDFLWVLSDNDPVADDSLTVIAAALQASPSPDLVVGVSDDALLGQRSLTSPVTSLGGAFHIGLISAVIYRWEAFVDSPPSALQALWTGWSQIALQEHAVAQRQALRLSCVPLDDLITHTRGDRSMTSVERARRAYSHSFYGGALLGYVSTELSGGDGRRALSRWWGDHWLHASAYRPNKAWECRNYRAGMVEALVRTGSPRDRLFWLMSLAPYWRVGFWLRKRGVDISRWT